MTSVPQSRLAKRSESDACSRLQSLQPSHIFSQVQTFSLRSASLCSVNSLRKISVKCDSMLEKLEIHCTRFKEDFLPLRSRLADLRLSCGWGSYTKLVKLAWVPQASLSLKCWFYFRMSGFARGSTSAPVKSEQSITRLDHMTSPYHIKYLMEINRFINDC